MATSDIGPITSLTAAQEQHMLFLFFPLKAGTLKALMGKLPGGAPAAPGSGGGPAVPGSGGGPDPRILPGVHFAMFYGLEADSQPKPSLPVPSFQTAKKKDLLVVLSIYDRDFAPYISAFTTNAIIAAGLDAVLSAMDETGIVPDTDKTSANFIIKHGGVAKNNNSFIQLLMRYNFSDPTIPAANVFPINTPANPKFRLLSTFPGLTVGSIIQNYPNATTLWPTTNAPNIKFEPSAPPPKVPQA